MAKIGETGALKILAWPKKGGWGAVGPLPRFFGGFDIVYRGKPEVIMDPKRKSRRSSRSDLLYQIRSW